LVAIVEKLHSKDPAARYQSAAEIAELLNRYLAHVQHPSLASLPQSIGADTSQRRSDAPGEYRDAEAANVRFHLAIASAARNTLAMELIDRCLAKVDRFMSLGVHFGPFQQGATGPLATCRRLRRDPRGAHAMEEHLGAVAG
jgi:DNA-binding GntR family transcriptional regulator